jgi:hypothetical protein
VEATDDGGAPAWLNEPMSGSPIRRERDPAIAARTERRLRLVIQILNARDAGYRKAHQPTPAGLRQSIADFGQQLGEVQRRQTDLAPEPEPARPKRPSQSHRTGRFTTHRARDFLPESH